MKIKNFMVIPLIAILVALFTIGAVPGVAADTTASEITTTDPLTYVPVTPPATSSLEEEIEGAVSNVLGDTLKDSEDEARGFSKFMGDLLASIKNILNSIIRIFQIGGGMLGDSGAFQDGIF